LLSPNRRAGPSTVLEPLLRPDPPSARTLRAIRRQSGIDQEEIESSWTKVLFRVRPVFHPSIPDHEERRRDGVIKKEELIFSQVVKQ
jgi:hypothetical protein